MVSAGPPCLAAVQCNRGTGGSEKSLMEI
ncbi:hypothetical protein CIB84_001039 [Bambusicola thoracicus]|uniref:Uncharacterized protein n=1 Tax=Bambusicola thoracicus TaxID=9083 RepID=A0A2P4TFT8_BAMTH|nr:hypothetical protein CIB84_001039 [Bambusicola thoracicus]